MTAPQTGHSPSARPATVAAYQRHAAAAARSSEAQAVTAGLRALEDLHRHPADPVSPPVAVEEPAVDEEAIRRRHIDAATAGIAFWKRAERRAALDSAARAAAAEITEAEAERDRRRRAAQAELDERWRELLANQPDVVLATLVEAFEDNEMHAAAVSVDGAEVSIAVFVPGEDIVPDRKPVTTAAGNPSLQKMSMTDRAGFYRIAVCGHVLAAVREALAVAPAVQSVRVAAVRVSEPDVYARTHPECLLAGTFTRAALAGVDWSSASSPEVVEQTATDLSTHLAGRVHELEPIDLAAEPDLAALVAAVDVDHDDGDGRQ